MRFMVYPKISSQQLWVPPAEHLQTKMAVDMCDVSSCGLDSGCDH